MKFVDQLLDGKHLAGLFLERNYERIVILGCKFSKDTPVRDLSECARYLCQSGADYSRSHIADGRETNQTFAGGCWRLERCCGIDW